MIRMRSNLNLKNADNFLPYFLPFILMQIFLGDAIINHGFGAIRFGASIECGVQNITMVWCIPDRLGSLYKIQCSRLDVVNAAPTSKD